MNTTARRFARFSMTVATLAAAFAAQTAGAADKVVRLDTVVVTGHRAGPERLATVELPTVTVIGRRTVAADGKVRLVRLPTVVVTGQRSPGAVAVLLQKGARGAAAGKSAV